MAEGVSDSERCCMANSRKFCIYQTSETGLRPLYPDAESLPWVQCQMCKGWLHRDCAGNFGDPFNCGCTDVYGSTRILAAVENGGFLSVFSKDQIKSSELLRVIEEATGIGAKIKRGEIQLLDFVFDVMLPEIIIKMLQAEGVSRLQAEIIMARGTMS